MFFSCSVRYTGNNYIQVNCVSCSGDNKREVGKFTFGSIRILYFSHYRMQHLENVMKTDINEKYGLPNNTKLTDEYNIKIKKIKQMRYSRQKPVRTQQETTLLEQHSLIMRHAHKPLLKSACNFRFQQSHSANLATFWNFSSE